ncbi:hypothetical protein QQ045_013618 [Rhodiola kirilowii]
MMHSSLGDCSRFCRCVVRRRLIGRGKSLSRLAGVAELFFQAWNQSQIIQRRLARAQKGKAPVRKIQTGLSGKDYPLSIQEMKSIFSNMLGRERSREEIEEIAEAPAKAESLIMNYRSLHYELNIMKKDHTELKQAVESCQPKVKGWWEVNVDELNSVEKQFRGVAAVFFL